MTYFPASTHNKNLGLTVHHMATRYTNTFQLVAEVKMELACKANMHPSSQANAITICTYTQLPNSERTRNESMGDELECWKRCWTNKSLMTKLARIEGTRHRREENCFGNIGQLARSLSQSPVQHPGMHKTHSQGQQEQCTRGKKARRNNTILRFHDFVTATYH